MYLLANSVNDFSQSESSGIRGLRLHSHSTAHVRHTLVSPAAPLPRIMLGNIIPLSSTSVIASILALVVLSVIYPMVKPRRPMKVKGRHVLITGASTGLGFALAEAMVKRGANVSILSKHPGRLTEAQQKLEAQRTDTTQRVLALQCDVTQAADVDRAVKQAVDQLGAPAYVFPAAGLALPGWFTDVPVEDHRAQMELNYFGTLYTVKACIPSMVAAKGGSLCFVSSALSLLAFAGYSMYCPTKYALRGLADSLRNEMIMHNINVRHHHINLLACAMLAQKLRDFLS